MILYGVFLPLLTLGVQNSMNEYYCINVMKYKIRYKVIISEAIRLGGVW